MRILKKLPVVAGIVVTLSLLGAVAYLLFFCPWDITTERTGNQQIFGATYMTMNNL